MRSEEWWKGRTTYKVPQYPFYEIRICRRKHYSVQIPLIGMTVAGNAVKLSEICDDPFRRKGS